MSSIEQLFFNKYEKYIYKSSSEFATQCYPHVSQIEKMDDEKNSILVNTYNMRNSGNDTNKYDFDVKFEYTKEQGKIVFSTVYQYEDSDNNMYDWQALDEWMYMMLNDGWLAKLQKAYSDKYHTEENGWFVNTCIDGVQWWISYTAALRLDQHTNPRPDYEQQFLDKYEHEVKSTTMTKIPRDDNEIIDMVYTYKLSEHTIAFKYTIVVNIEDDGITKFGNAGKILLDDVAYDGWFEVETALNGGLLAIPTRWPLCPTSTTCDADLASDNYVDINKYY